MSTPTLRQSCNITNPSAYRSVLYYVIWFGGAGWQFLGLTVRHGAQATTTVSDNINGTWTQLGSFVLNGSNSGSMWYVKSAAGSPTITIGNSALVSYGVQTYIGEYTGVVAIRTFGQIANGGTSSTTGTTPNALAWVTTGDLIIVGIFNSTSASGTYTAGSLSGVTGSLAMGSSVANQNACQEWAVATSSGVTVKATAHIIRHHVADGYSGACWTG